MRACSVSEQDSHIPEVFAATRTYADGGRRTNRQAMLIDTGMEAPLNPTPGSN
jgi:hypothetical protein